MRSRDERVGSAAIADRLNAEGHPTRTGKPWPQEAVRGIIQRKVPEITKMAQEGLEPPRGCPQQILSLPCLPFHHWAVGKC